MDKDSKMDYRKELFKTNGRWFARFPDLPGCLADGETGEEALANGNEAKAFWLETAQRLGKEIPVPSEEPPYSGKLNLRLPRGLHEAAARGAEREGTSLNTYLVQLISEGVERTGLKSLFSLLEGRLQKAFRGINWQQDADGFSVSIEVKSIGKAAEITRGEAPEPEIKAVANG